MTVDEELWRAFNDIYFDEGPHTYTNSLGTQFTSVTTLVGQFGEKFDSNKVIDNMTKRAIEQHKPLPDRQKLIAEWKYSGDYAKLLGTEIHSVMENLWYHKNYTGRTELMSKYAGMQQDFEQRKTYCKKLYTKMSKMYVPIRNEFIVYDVDNAICGTIDMLAYNTQKKCYSILDWKTSKSFDTHSCNHETLKTPFESFEACNVNEYSIQLSLYAWMIEKHTSLRIGEMTLFQIPKQGTVPVIVNCNDMRVYLNRILK